MDKKSRAKLDGLSFQIKAEENPNQESIIGLDDLDLEDVQLKPLSVKIMVKSDKKKFKDQPFAFIPKSSGSSPTRMVISDEKFAITTSAQTLVNFGVVVGNTPSAAIRPGRKGCLDPPFDDDPQAYGKTNVNKRNVESAPSVVFSGLLHIKKSKEKKERQNVPTLDNVPITTLFDRRSSVLDNNTPKTEIRDEVKAMRSVAEIEKFMTESIVPEKESDRTSNRLPIADDIKYYERRAISGDVHNKLQPFFTLQSESTTTPFQTDSINSLEKNSVRIEEGTGNNEVEKYGFANTDMMAADGAGIATNKFNDMKNKHIPFQNLDKRLSQEKSLRALMKDSSIDFSKDNELSQDSNKIISRYNVKNEGVISPIVSGRRTAASRSTTLIQSDSVKNKSFFSQNAEEKNADQIDKFPNLAPKGEPGELSNKPSHDKNSRQISSTGVEKELETQPTFQIEYNLPEPLLVTKVVLSAVNTSANVNEPTTKLHSASSHLQNENCSNGKQNDIEKPSMKENIYRTEVPTKTKRKEINGVSALVGGEEDRANVMEMAGIAEYEARKHSNLIKHSLDEINVNRDISASSLNSKITPNLPKYSDIADQINLQDLSHDCKQVSSENEKFSTKDIKAITERLNDSFDKSMKSSVSTMSRSQKIGHRTKSKEKPEIAGAADKENISYTSSTERLSKVPVFPFLAKDNDTMQRKNKSLSNQISVDVEVGKKDVYETDSNRAPRNEKIQTKSFTKGRRDGSHETSKTNYLQNQPKNNIGNAKELLDKDFYKVPSFTPKPVASSKYVSEKDATRRTDSIKKVDDEEATRLFENSGLQSEKSSFLRQENMDYTSPSGILSQNDDVSSNKTETSTQQSGSNRLRSPKDFTSSKTVKTMPNSVSKLSNAHKKDSPLQPYMTEMLDPRQQETPLKNRSADLNNSNKSIISEISDSKLKRRQNESKQNSLSHSTVEGQSQTTVGRSQIISSEIGNESKAQYRSSRSGVLNIENTGQTYDVNKFYHSNQEPRVDSNLKEVLSPQNTLSYIVHEDIDETQKSNITNDEITLPSHATRGQAPRSQNSPSKQTQRTEYGNRNFPYEIFYDEPTRHTYNINDIQELLAIGQEEITHKASSIGLHSSQRGIYEHKHEDRHDSPECKEPNNDITAQSDNLRTGYETNSSRKLSRDSSRHRRSNLKAIDRLTRNQMDIVEVNYENTRRMNTATVDDSDNDKSIGSENLNLSKNQSGSTETSNKSTESSNNQRQNNRNEGRKTNTSNEPDEKNKLDVLNNLTVATSTNIVLNLAFRNIVLDNVCLLQSIDPDDEVEMANKENLSVISTVLTHTGFISKIPINNKRDANLCLYGKDFPANISTLLENLESQSHDVQNYDVSKNKENDSSTSDGSTVQDPVTIVKLSFKRIYSPNDDKWILKTINTEYAVADDDIFTFIKNPLLLQEYITIPINEQNTVLIIFRNNESINSQEQIEEQEKENLTNDQKSSSTSVKGVESETEKSSNNEQSETEKLSNNEQSENDKTSNKEQEKESLPSESSVRSVGIFLANFLFVFLEYQNSQGRPDKSEESQTDEKPGGGDSTSKKSEEEEPPIEPNDDDSTRLKLNLDFTNEIDTDEKSNDQNNSGTAVEIKESETDQKSNNEQEKESLPCESSVRSIGIFLANFLFVLLEYQNSQGRPNESKESETNEKPGGGDSTSDKSEEEESPIEPNDDDSTSLKLNLAFKEDLTFKTFQSVDWDDKDGKEIKRIDEELSLASNRSSSITASDMVFYIDLLANNTLEPKLCSKKEFLTKNNDKFHDVIILAFKRSYSPNKKMWILKTIDYESADLADESTFILSSKGTTSLTIPINNQIRANLNLDAHAELNTTAPKGKDGCEGATDEIHLHLCLKQIFNKQDGTWTLVTFSPGEKNDKHSNKCLIKDNLRPNADNSQTIAINSTTNKMFLVDNAKYSQNEKDDKDFVTPKEDFEHPTYSNQLDNFVEFKKTKAEVTEQSMLKNTVKISKAKISSSIRILDANLKNQTNVISGAAALVEIEFEGEDVLIKGSQFRDVNVETFPADTNLPSNFVTSLYKEIHKTRVNVKNQELTLCLDAEKHKELCIEIASNGRKMTKLLQPGGSPVLYAHAGKRITFQLKEMDSDDGAKICENIRKPHCQTNPNRCICRCHKKKT